MSNLEPNGKFSLKILWFGKFLQRSKQTYASLIRLNRARMLYSMGFLFVICVEAKTKPSLDVLSLSTQIIRLRYVIKFAPTKCVNSLIVCSNCRKFVGKWSVFTPICWIGEITDSHRHLFLLWICSIYTDSKIPSFIAFKIQFLCKFQMFIFRHLLAPYNCALNLVVEYHQLSTQIFHTNILCRIKWSNLKR